MNTRTVEPKVKQRVMFSDPLARANGRDWSLYRRWVKLIRATPRGETIRVAFTRITMPAVTNALIAAHRRGVRVFVVNSGVHDNVGASKLEKALGRRHLSCRGKNRSSNLSCLSRRSSAVMHSKYLTFSRTGDRKNVVVVGSLHPSLYQAELFNDQVEISGDRKVYDGFVANFRDMFHERRGNDYMKREAGTLRSRRARARAWFSPVADSKKAVSAEASTDVVVRTMRKIRTGGGDFLAAQVLVSSARMPIVDELERIAKLGNRVKLLASQIDPPVVERLRKAGVEVRRLMVPRGDHLVGIHHKFYLRRGSYDRDPNAGLVFTGSHNWTNSALRRNEEVLLRLGDSNVVRSYERHFERMWRRASEDLLSPVPEIVREELPVPPRFKRRPRAR